MLLKPEPYEPIYSPAYQGVLNKMPLEIEGYGTGGLVIPLWLYHNVCETYLTYHCLVSSALELRSVNTMTG